MSPAAGPWARLWRQTRETAEMIKISHSVFALPFAVAAAALAAADAAWDWTQLLWIVVCAVTARTAAMAQNRLADARIDALNPRTKDRALPAGRVSRGYVVSVIVLSCALFVFSAGRLNDLCLVLSPVVLIWLLAYPYTKRFTSLAHLWLGAALGLAPVGAWVAVRGSFEGWPTPVLLGFAVAFWTGGFDLIYACQDADVDRKLGLHSVPALLGVKRALRHSVLLHVVTMALLTAVLWVNPHVGWLYGAGLVAAAVLLWYEHSLVKPDDLSRVNMAFFTLNGLVSLVVGGLTIADAFV